jgi:hypothetical protein
VNRLPPRRFAAADVTALARLDPAHPHVVAANFHVERRRQAEEQLAALRRAVGTSPVRLAFRFTPPDAPADVIELAADLAAAAGLAA